MKKFLSIIISAFMIITFTLCAEASDNILRSVDVQKGANSYTVEIASSFPAKMSKTIISANRILINIKDIKLSDNLSTKFENNPVTDSVMVEECGQDAVNILVQGDNIAYSSVEFKAPTSLQIAEDSVLGTIKSLIGIFSGTSKSERTFQYGVLFIILFVLIAELRFVKSKYDELELEKELLLKDMENTKDFKDYLPGFGGEVLTKPYTTPMFGRGVNTSSKTNTHISVPNTLTVNSLLNKKSNYKSLDRIVNNHPVFGELSGVKLVNTVFKSESAPVSNPLSKAKLKSNLRYLEALTEQYKQKTTVQDLTAGLRARLNTIY